MTKTSKSGSKKFILAAISAAVLAAPSAYAGAVVNWTGTDGFSAEPYIQGTNILHLRLDSAFPGFSQGNALMPGLNFTTAITDGLDLGIGGGVNFNGIGSSLNSVSMGAVYPWVRAAVPLGIENVKTGIMVGTSIPLNVNSALSSIGGVNNMANRLGTEFFPGITGLMDVYLGQLTGSAVPLTMGVNAGYARGITSGTNLVSGNLNFTLPTNGLILYEEQFVNVPVGNYTNGGIRLGVNVPVGDRWMFDIKPAALWDASSTGVTWTFNPSIGASMKF
jgi:hypothetical protein